MLWESGTELIPREDARAVYYRLTGRPFNSVPPPASVAPLFSDRPDSFERNPEMRDGTVGWIDKDLTLKASRIDSIVDAATATGYVDAGMTLDAWKKALAERGIPQDIRIRAPLLL